MEKLIELTKDVWRFGCKGDVIGLSAERLKELEAHAEKLGETVYVEVKGAATAAGRAAAAAEAEVVTEAPKVEAAAEAVAEDVKDAVKKAKK